MRVSWSGTKRRAETMLPTGLALERRFPRLVGMLPRLPLVVAPTPVHALDGLGARLGRAGLWIKRDDRSGHGYGGNKPRKLEFLLGSALLEGRRSVLTFGALGSHHGLATAIAARTVGLRTILVLLPQPVTASVRRTLLLAHGYGAELHFAPGIARAALTTVRLVARGARRRDVPAIIPPGGSSVAGVLGYVDAALELAEQVDAGALPAPDTVFVPLGTGGTAAGLLLGFALAGLRTRVVAVLVTDILPPTPERLLRLARAAGRRLRRLDPTIPEITLGVDDVAIVRTQLGAGYGRSTRAAAVAAELMERSEGIALDATYSAKCLAALLHAAREPRYAGRPLLFWNTYSSIDPAAGLATLPDPSALPPAFARFFREAEPVAPAEA
jgi:D-cysteine desulfhydrase